MYAPVKELLKSDSICKSYAEMIKGPVFFDSQCIFHVAACVRRVNKNTNGIDIFDHAAAIYR